MEKVEKVEKLMIVYESKEEAKVIAADNRQN